MSDEERPNNDDATEPLAEEEGSDELLADDALRLPESANIRVRLHAVRAWLARRRHEAALSVGEAALALQAATQSQQEEQRLRRRRASEEASSFFHAQITRAQEHLRAAQETLRAFDEAQEKLDECIDHANGERVLVEYYLLLEQTFLDAGYLPNIETTGEQGPWYEAMVEVMRRIEHVGIPEES